MRTCTECNAEMAKGYCINGGMEYYCTVECLAKNYTPDELIDLEVGEDDSDSYWTEWEVEVGQEEEITLNIDEALDEEGNVVTIYDMVEEYDSCPRCFGEMSVFNHAICRHDDETVICSDCGVEQAMKELEELIIIETQESGKIQDIKGCLLCETGTLVGKVINEATAIWVCDECPCIMFEYQGPDNVDDLNDYLNRKI